MQQAQRMNRKMINMSGKDSYLLERNIYLLLSRQNPLTPGRCGNDPQMHATDKVHGYLL